MFLLATLSKTKKTFQAQEKGFNAESTMRREVHVTGPLGGPAGPWAQGGQRGPCGAGAATALGRGSPESVTSLPLFPSSCHGALRVAGVGRQGYLRTPLPNQSCILKGSLRVNGTKEPAQAVKWQRQHRVKFHNIAKPTNHVSAPPNMPGRRKIKIFISRDRTSASRHQN